MKGIVVKSTGSWYQVMLNDATVIECRIRGKIRLEGAKTTNPVAVGDSVSLDWEDDNEEKGVITEIDVRTNFLARKSVNLSKRVHILAANIDRCYLLVTLREPLTHLAFIDRFLTAAESFRIPTTLLFNKIDIYSTEELEQMEERIDMYENIGYPCHKISALNPEDIEFLRNEINEKQVLFAGHSGAGKSTLTNAIDPNLQAKVGEISTSHAQGKHTTTFAEMHPVSTGGFIIDTPGIKAFGLIDLEKTVLAHYFPEMRAVLNKCKYHNCLHLSEPQCYVKELVENGEIYPSRYDNYVQMMLNDDDEHYRKAIMG